MIKLRPRINQLFCLIYLSHELYSHGNYLYLITYDLMVKIWSYQMNRFFCNLTLLLKQFHV
jgi:hypothetical protein